jgi:predicted O-methyltransferase YrrM
MKVPVKRFIRSNFNRLVGNSKYNCLERAVIELNNAGELRKAFGWSREPVLDIPIIYKYDYLEDANDRRLRDAETLGTVVCNTDPAICLEIGTAFGHSTALMSINAPKSRIYTVNIPPEEITSGKGGDLTTIAIKREEIGSYYLSRGLTNITQILANTAYWEPEIGAIDVAFIDGCHDTNFVYNDTRKILRLMRPGSFIIWHDFNLELSNKYNWIGSVCQGVERLYAYGLLEGRLLHIRDSWMGVYRVGKEARMDINAAK